MTELILPAFIAGVLTFLAPCTLPLVPAYLSFISGASAKELQNSQNHRGIRSRIFFNGLFYIAGFSIVFILFGTIFGIAGSALMKYQFLMQRIGGGFIFIFALYLLGFFEKIPVLNTFFSQEYRFHRFTSLKPGTSVSSFILGATFAFGWTPCVGPILGSILLLASTTSTAAQGAFLLAVFSCGLALPFLFIAFFIGYASKISKNLSRVLPFISFVGGIFLLFLSILLLTDNMDIWLSWAYGVFNILEYEKLLNYL